MTIRTLTEMAEMLAGPRLTKNQRAFFEAVQGASAAFREDEARMRLWQDQVVITVIPFNVADRAGILLQNIRAVNPGNRQGGKALDWLCALADAHEQFIEAMPEMLPSRGSKIADETDLRNWYARRGFRGGAQMRRLPQPPAPC